MDNTLITGMMLCLCAPALAGDFEQTINASEVRHVTIGLTSGEIEVTGWKKQTIEIVATVDPHVKVDGKTVGIGLFDLENPPTTSDEARQWGVEVEELRVHMPEGADLTVRTLAGDLRIKNLTGRTTVAVVSGDIRVENCSGPLEIDAVSGEIDIRGLTADLTAQAVSGDIEVRGFDALMLEAKSVSGSVTVRDTKARTVRLSSHSGDVTYAGSTPSDGSIELTTFSGDAVATLPADSGFEVDGTTFSGSVSLEREAEISDRSNHRLRARTSKPGPRLRLKSYSGNIVMK